MAKLKLDLDLQALQAQFRGLQGRHPGLWPFTPRIALLTGAVVVVLLAGWLLYWDGLFQELDGLRSREEQLKGEYADKMKQAINIDVLRKQKEQVAQYVSLLEKQLPGKAEMDALLTDINQAGVGRGLQFELFRPGQVMVKDYYAELPISIKISGNYHDLGAFTSDVSNLPRIVTLNNLMLQMQEKTGLLTMEAVAKTYRYLDPDEIAAARREMAERKKKAGVAK